MIQLEFLYIDIEGDEKDCYDSVTIYDGDHTTASRIGSYCGNILPDDVISRSNAMFVVFETDYLYTKTGFVAKYYARSKHSGKYCY